MIEYLKGKKTYFLAAAAIGFAITGVYTGNLDANQAIAVIWSALTAMGLRAGIKNSINELLKAAPIIMAPEPTPAPVVPELVVIPEPTPTTTTLPIPPSGFNYVLAPIYVPQTETGSTPTV